MLRQYLTPSTLGHHTYNITLLQSSNKYILQAMGLPLASR